MSDIEERIRRRAHEIWEREGRPHGRHDEHWAQAQSELAAEDALAADGTDTTKSDTATTAKSTGRRSAKADAKPKGKSEAGSAAVKTDDIKPADESGTHAAAETLSAVAAGPADAAKPAGRKSSTRKAAADTAPPEQQAPGGKAAGGKMAGRKGAAAKAAAEPVSSGAASSGKSARATRKDARTDGQKTAPAR